MAPSPPPQPARSSSVRLPDAEQQRTELLAWLQSETRRLSNDVESLTAAVIATQPSIATRLAATPPGLQMLAASSARPNTPPTRSAFHTSASSGRAHLQLPRMLPGFDEFEADDSPYLAAGPRHLTRDEVKTHTTRLELRTIQPWSRLFVAQVIKRYTPLIAPLLHLPSSDFFRCHLEPSSPLESQDEWLGTTLLACLDSSALAVQNFRAALDEAAELEPRALTSGHYIYHAILRLLRPPSVPEQQRRAEEIQATRYLAEGMPHERATAAVRSLKSDFALLPAALRSTEHALYRFLLTDLARLPAKPCTDLHEKLVNELFEAEAEGLEPKPFESYANRIISTIGRVPASPSPSASAATTGRPGGGGGGGGGDPPTKPATGPCNICGSSDHLSSDKDPNGQRLCRARCSNRDCCGILCPAAYGGRCLLSYSEMPKREKLLNANGNPLPAHCYATAVKCHSQAAAAGALTGIASVPTLTGHAATANPSTAEASTQALSANAATSPSMILF